MLTQVDILTERGSTLSLPLQDTGQGYVITNIEGLDPVEAVLVSSSFADVDGEQYHTSRRSKRNILLSLRLDPDYSETNVTKLRNNLYRYFMPKTQVTLRFHGDDLPTANIVGRVETFDSPQFTNEPEVVISIVCFDPDFTSPEVFEFSGQTTSGVVNGLIDYQGTVETGIIFRMTVPRMLTEFSIYARSFNNVDQLLDFRMPLLAGDTIEISTLIGRKGATLLRSGVASSALYGVSPYSKWISLDQGWNDFRVSAAGAPIPFTIEFWNRYGGL